MLRRQILTGVGAAALALAAFPALAQETVKVGLILPMTGPSASTGRQVEAGARLWMAQNGDTVAGKKIQLIIKDDTGAADQSKRLATELVVNDKVAFLGGFGLTPLALSVGPVATQAKVPAVIMAAGTSTIVSTSPYFVRTSFTLPQNTVPMAQWSAANNIKTVVTLVSDYGPGLDSEKAFKAEFEAKGGKVLETLRAPLANPEFAAFLQKA
jgi:branched-chain amino acid transport system substrate-binding protein